MQVWATVVHGSAGLHDAVAAGGVTVVVPPDFVATSIAWPMPALMEPPVAAETRSLQYAPARHVEIGLDEPAAAAAPPSAPASPAPASPPLAAPASPPAAPASNDDIKAAEGIVGDDYEGYQLTGDDFMGLPGVNTTAGRVGNFVGCPDCGWALPRLPPAS